MAGFLYKSLIESCKSYPDKTVLLFDENQKITFKDLVFYVNRIINYLQNLGLNKGDKIFLALGSRLEFCSILYAANALGIIVVPVSTKLKDAGIRNIADTVTPKYVFYTQKQSFIKDIFENTICITDAFDYSKYSDTVNIDVNQVESNDPAIIMFTSGTTSAPKGAIISNSNIEAAVDAYTDALQLTDKDSTILGVPIFHITGLVAILALFIKLGATIYVEQRFNAPKILELINKYDVTFLHGSPTVFSLLHIEASKISNNQTYDSLKSIACGAGRLNRGTIDALKKLFPNSQVHTVYGLTESTSPFTLYRGDVSLTKLADCSGTPVKGAKLQIRDQYNNVLNPNQIGTIWISGPMVIKRYIPMSDENKKLFDGEFLNTGDVGYIDNYNNLYVKDRIKNIINRGGEKIFCPEVESVISTYPEIIEVALVGKDDPIYGEIPIAFIKVEHPKNFDEQKLNEFICKHCPKFQVPSAYRLIEDFPRTSNGKINKRELKKLI